jgi:hypothetical protein
MKITDLAKQLNVSRQYIDITCKRMGMVVKKPHGIKWLSKPQIAKLTAFVKGGK